MVFPCVGRAFPCQAPPLHSSFFQKLRKLLSRDDDGPTGLAYTRPRGAGSQPTVKTTGVDRETPWTGEIADLAPPALSESLVTDFDAFLAKLRKDESGGVVAIQSIATKRLQVERCRNCQLILPSSFLGCSSAVLKTT